MIKEEISRENGGGRKKKGYKLIACNPLNFLVAGRGFEPLTFGL